MFRRPFLFAALACLALHICAHAGPGDFFGIEVVDESTGRGIPMVTLETVNGIRLVTDSAGWAAFQEPGLMGKKVYLTLSSPGYAMPKDASGHPGTAVTTTPGTATQIKLVRVNIAERMYRVTGQGIYRDTTLLGREAPLPQANLYADLMGLESVQAALLDGKIFWLWADTRVTASPLGNIHVTAATSDLPESGGLHPSLGVHFKYLLNTKADGVRRMVPMTEPGAIQIDGLLPVKGGDAREKLLAHYSRMKAPAERLEHGLVEYNEESGVFEQVLMLGEEFKWQCPRGHAVRVTAQEGDWFYFADPFCHTRIRADYDSLMNPTAFESLTYSTATGAYEWKARSTPVSQDEEALLLTEKKIPESAARYALKDVSGGRALRIHSASIQWNEFRKRWIMIGVEKDGEESPLGEVWYAESAKVEGPWSSAVKIATHPGHSLLRPCQHVFFNQEGGRVIFFEGTFRSTPAGKTEATPRYDHNQLMYRLDLSDRRLKAAQQ